MLVHAIPSMSSLRKCADALTRQRQKELPSKISVRVWRCSRMSHLPESTRGLRKLLRRTQRTGPPR